jgi:hypothetical protein
MELLAWVRGPGLALAIIFMLVGVVVRLLEMFMLGRKTDLSEARVKASGKYGWRTVFTRSLPNLSCGQSLPVVFISAYIFHIGLFLTVFFFVPHIQFIRDLTGLQWPGMSFWLIDSVTLISMLAMLVALWYRWWDKVRRYISRFSDYFVWTLTFLPLLSGYLLYHRQLFPYNEMMIVHIVSVELLLISLPLTKLMHTFTFIFSRWYTGAAAGRKGVKI